MPFQPGQSGNPLGRPRKGLALSDIICAKLSTKKGGRTRLEAIIAKAIEQAEKGDRDARTWLSDRGWGRPVPVLDAGEEMIVTVKTASGADPWIQQPALVRSANGEGSS